MFVAACIRRLPKSIARNGPQANAPSPSASAVPKSTGTADAVRLKGRASLNHSATMGRWGFGAFIVAATGDGLEFRHEAHGSHHEVSSRSLAVPYSCSNGVIL